MPENIVFMNYLKIFIFPEVFVVDIFFIHTDQINDFVLLDTNYYFII